jgi:hypothetical protein
VAGCAGGRARSLYLQCVCSHVDKLELPGGTALELKTLHKSLRTPVNTGGSGPAPAPGHTPGTGLGDERGLRSEIPPSVGSGRGTVSLPRNISHGGGANTGHLQNAIQSRHQAVLAASRAHTLSYSQTAVEKEEKDETFRLQTLMGKNSLHENSDTQGSPLTSNENLELEGLIHQRKIRVAAKEAAKVQKSLGDQTRGAKTKSPASVVKTLSGACVIFEKTDDSMDEEVHRVSDNFLIPVNDPGTPGSLATALLDIVSKEISIREEWTREHITAFMCSPTSNLTVIYRGPGGACDQANVSGVITTFKDASRIYICLTKNDQRTKTFLREDNKARQSPQVHQ